MKLHKIKGKDKSIFKQPEKKDRRHTNDKNIQYFFACKRGKWKNQNVHKK